MPLSKPWDGIRETGLKTLISKDNAVAQYDYGPSVSITLEGVQPSSGKILAVALYASETGSGAIITEAGRLFIFDANPAVANGDANLVVGEWPTIVATITIAASDWIEENASGAGSMVYKVGTEYPFHAVQTLYAVYYHEGTTTINSAAGDEETLKLNLWYERYS